MWRIINLKITEIGEASVLSSVEAGCILCHSGRMTLDVDGIGRGVAGGDLFLYPPYASVAVKSVAAPVECTVCEVDHEFVLSALKAVSWGPKLQYLAQAPVASLSDEARGRIESIISLISKEISCEDDQLAMLSVGCLRRALAYEVLRGYLQRIDLPSGDGTSRDSIVLLFQQALKKDAVRHRDVKHYATLQGLSPRYFSTAVRALTGYPPLYWISRAVMVEAQHLMLDSTLSLKEITFRLNFSSQTFFSRWYRLYAGETPSDFRKRNGVNAPDLHRKHN